MLYWTLLAAAVTSLLLSIAIYFRSTRRQAQKASKQSACITAMIDIYDQLIIPSGPSSHCMH